MLAVNRKPLEVLEISFLRQGRRLIERILDERDGDEAVQCVEQFVLTHRQMGMDGVDFLLTSDGWREFVVRFPSGAERIERLARK
jgi:hypothetical protein